MTRFLVKVIGQGTDIIYWAGKGGLNRKKYAVEHNEKFVPLLAYTNGFKTREKAFKYLEKIRRQRYAFGGCRYEIVAVEVGE